MWKSYWPNAASQVDHVTIYRWVQRFTLELIDAARPSRQVAGDRWFVDETDLKVAGQWVYLYRAIDQHGQVIDVLASPKRDLAATRRFFARRPGTALSSHLRRLRRPRSLLLRDAGARFVGPRHRVDQRGHH
jgi:transposase-like protein